MYKMDVSQEHLIVYRNNKKLFKCSKNKKNFEALVALMEEKVEIIEDLSIIGRIKHEMKNHGITQAKLAEILDISRVALNNKLNQKSNFKVNELKEIAELFSIDIKELL